MRRARTLIVWLVLLAVLIAVVLLKSGPRYGTSTIEQFVADIHAKKIADVLLYDDDSENPLQSLLAVRHDGSCYYVHDVDNEVFKAVLNAKIPLQNAASRRDGKNSSSSLGRSLIELLVYVGILAGLILLLVWLYRRIQGSAKGFWELRRNQAKLATASEKITFADIGGLAEVKTVLNDIVLFLKSPQLWEASGARLPRGILLEGPPGSGKTLLARAVAGESSASFYYVSASEFVEMIVGVGASRIRSMFEEAHKSSPAVLFIDELDAIGSRRYVNHFPGNEERHHALNQLLTCMDGFKRSTKIVVMAATNRYDILDPALVRSGRFDRRIKTQSLSADDRRQILQIHVRNKTLAPDVSLDALAQRTAGMTGADLENIVNEAALVSVRGALTRSGAGGLAQISAADIETAVAVIQRQRAVIGPLDDLLLQSMAKLSEPSEPLRVRLVFRDGLTMEGEVIWAEASSLKIRQSNNKDIVIAKSEVRSFEDITLNGT